MRQGRVAYAGSAEALEVTDAYPSRQGQPSRIIGRGEPVVFSETPVGKYSLAGEHLRFYRENGYLLLKGWFTEEATALMQEEFARLLANREIRDLENVICEPGSREIRSLFDLPVLSALYGRLCRSRRVLDAVMQILGGPVYLHQSRINIKPAFWGKSFPWHSDFETWHVEDGFPRMRCLSCSIFLTENNHWNGPLFVIPGSHRHYVSCSGLTPDDHYRESLKNQYYGSPDVKILGKLMDQGAIETCTGGPGDMLIFDGNMMHGSPDNISHLPRTNIFLAYNSCENPPVEPYCGLKRRPAFLASRECTPLVPLDDD